MVSLESRVADLTRYGRHSRRMILATIGSLILDLGLTAALTVVSIQAHEAASQASENRQAAVVSCQETNIARAQNQALWNHLIAISMPPPKATAAERAQQARELAQLKGYIAQVFAPRDCQHLFPGQH